jgi:chromosome segregation ATPase
LSDDLSATNQANLELIEKREELTNALTRKDEHLKSLDDAFESREAKLVDGFKSKEAQLVAAFKNKEAECVKLMEKCESQQNEKKNLNLEIAQLKTRMARLEMHFQSLESDHISLLRIKIEQSEKQVIKFIHCN